MFFFVSSSSSVSYVCMVVQKSYYVIWSGQRTKYAATVYHGPGSLLYMPVKTCVLCVVVVVPARSCFVYMFMCVCVFCASSSLAKRLIPVVALFVDSSSYMYF